MKTVIIKPGVMYVFVNQQIYGIYTISQSSPGGPGAIYIPGSGGSAAARSCSATRDTREMMAVRRHVWRPWRYLHPGFGWLRGITQLLSYKRH